MGEAHAAEALAGERPVGGGKAPEEAWQRGHVAEPAGQHVVQHGGATHEVELLEDHADLPAGRPQLGGAGAGDRAARHPNAAGGGLDQTVQRPEQRRLAAAAAAEDHDELARRDGEVDAVHGGHRRREDDA